MTTTNHPVEHASSSRQGEGAAVRTVIKIEGGITRMPQWRMAEPVDFELREGEQLAIIGPNGGGKTKLVDIITGRHPLIGREPFYDFSPSSRRLVSENIQYIAFRDTYGGDNDRTYFLQQRWNQTEIDAETPTAHSVLEKTFLQTGDDTPARRQRQRDIYQLFHMEHFLDKYVVQLSSGELRKLKLAQTLFADPRVLIMDNPFIGLDAETRQQLTDLLANIAATSHTQMILILNRTADIPSFITHIITVSDLHVDHKLTLDDWRASTDLADASNMTDKTHKSAASTPSDQPPVIEMRHVSIRYGARTILHDLDWTVHQGEHWALSGQNGAGKSTLLSLVCADNPQSYACDISLFGHKRGSGESIWDIKRHIGYVSPEMHRSYHRDIATLRVVASGLKDTVGLYVRPTDDELEQCRKWLDVFGLASKADVSFLHLSSGEQRLALLARAFVKSPDLLILDEPLHGLDDRNRQLVRDIIERYCQDPTRTLIMVSHYEEELPPCIDHRITLRRMA